MISWMSRKQKLIALSTTEAEYIDNMEELFDQVLDSTVTYCDNKSGIRVT